MKAALRIIIGLIGRIRLISPISRTKPIRLRKRSIPFVRLPISKTESKK